MTTQIFVLQLFCPKCYEQHIDEGEWITRPHKTHLCLKCGCLFKVKGYEELSTCGARITGVIGETFEKPFPFDPLKENLNPFRPGLI